MRSSLYAILVALPTTGNGFAMCGLLHLKVLLKTALSKKSFPLTKLQKKWKRKLFFATKNDETFNARAFNPAYCKTDVTCSAFFPIVFI